MDAPQNPQQQPSQTPVQPTDRAILEYLAWRYDRLQMLFQFALAGLLILSAALSIFIYKQMRLVRQQLAPQREATIRYSMEFHKRDDQTIRSFVGRLQEFAARNPDFRPVLDQHRTQLQPYFLPLPQKPAPSAAKTNR